MQQVLSVVTPVQLTTGHVRPTVLPRTTLFLILWLLVITRSAVLQEIENADLFEMKSKWRDWLRHIKQNWDLIRSSTHVWRSGIQAVEGKHGVLQLSKAGLPMSEAIMKPVLGHTCSKTHSCVRSMGSSVCYIQSVSADEAPDSRTGHVLQVQMLP